MNLQSPVRTPASTPCRTTRHDRAATAGSDFGGRRLSGSNLLRSVKRMDASLRDFHGTSPSQQGLHTSYGTGEDSINSIYRAESFPLMSDDFGSDLAVPVGDSLPFSPVKSCLSLQRR